jgi:hypothetical protein
MATDGGLGAMEDRPRGQQRLGGEKVLLHRQLVRSRPSMWWKFWCS